MNPPSDDKLPELPGEWLITESAEEQLTILSSRVHLPGVQGQPVVDPVVSPVTPEIRQLAHGRGHYQVLGEVTSGGTGAVFRARDPDIGRDVALKVLDESLLSRPRSVEHFVEEAQICGQLQHPGIAPIYELGLMEDERPYFAMKLVKGRTLSSLLEERDTPASDRPRFLSIFEQVCQTLAYAHARQVIHRDLKPSNVVIGAFGEVQIVSWGRARLLPREGEAVESRVVPPKVSVVERARSETGSSHSRIGSVPGPPACKPPGQARGELERLDEAADVHALGAILFQILTGATPHVGGHDRTSRRAVQADLAEATEQLARCGADGALVRLALSCLAPEPRARPRNAEVVARAVQKHIASVESRVRRARLQAESSDARAEAERKARKVTVSLAGAIVLALLLGSMGFRIVQKNREESRQRQLLLVDEAMKEAIEMRGAGRLEGALAAGERARAVAASGESNATLEARVGEFLDDVQRAIVSRREQEGRDRENAELIARLERVRMMDRRDGSPALDEEGTHAAGVLLEHDEPESNWEARDRAYRAIFAERGIDLLSHDEVTAGNALSDTEIGNELALYLDDWARAHRKLGGRGSEQAEHLTRVARATDDSARRNQMRSAILTANRDALLSIAQEEGILEEEPVTLVVLARGMDELGLHEQGIDLLSRAVGRHPEDFMVNETLGYLLGRRHGDAQAHHEAALRYYRAARALRPDSVINLYSLGNCLYRLRRPAEAIRELEAAIRLDPEYHWAHTRLGNALSLLERHAEGIAAHERAIELAPHSGKTHSGLGDAFIAAGRAEEALAAFRRATEAAPRAAYHRRRQAHALNELERYREGIEAAEEALRIDPYDHWSYHEIGDAHAALEDWKASADLHRRAMDAEPETGHWRVDYVWDLVRLGDLKEAESKAREFLKRFQDEAKLHFVLGELLETRGLADQAQTAFDQALALDSENATFHSKLYAAMFYRQWGGSLPIQESSTRAHYVGVLRPNVCDTASGMVGPSLAAALEHLCLALELDPVHQEANMNVDSGLTTAFGADPPVPNLERFVARLKSANEMALSTAPELQHVQYARSSLAVFRGDWSEAALAFRELIRLDPAWAHGGLGDVLFKLGDIDGAIDDWTYVLELRPTSTSTLEKIRAVDPARAPDELELLRFELRLSPDDSRVLNNIAWELATRPSSGDAEFQEAVRFARRATRLDPREGYYWSTLGVALYRTDEWRPAIVALDQSILLSEDALAADLFFLAMANHRLGETRLARTLYEEGTAKLEESPSEEDQGFRAEAEALLGMDREGER